MPGAPGRLLSPSFVLVTASTFAYFLGLGSLLPTLPRFVEDGLGVGLGATGNPGGQAGSGGAGGTISASQSTGK